jgi:hypothetical protein
MAEVKKVEKMAEASGGQSVASAAPVAAAPKSFAQVRAEREASGEAGNAASVAYPESQPKEGDAKPSPRTQREMEAGGKAGKARAAEQGGSKK